jgi:hypothetical protein
MVSAMLTVMTLVMMVACGSIVGVGEMSVVMSMMKSAMVLVMAFGCVTNAL